MTHASRTVLGWTSLFLATACLLVGPVGCEEQDEKAPVAENLPPGPTPNIVFVLIDTLRADMLGTYGNPRLSTPALDAIAAEGVTFERAISAAPWTQPAIASLFCSRYPGAHGVRDYAKAFKSVYDKNLPAVAVFDDSFPTLAESLQDRGYATAGFGANPFITEAFGFAQGFDHFDTSFAKNTTPGGVVNDAALEWLKRRDPERPFFLFLHYMDPHGPYDTAPEFLDPLLAEVEALPDKRQLSREELEALDYLRKMPAPLRSRPRSDSEWQRHAKLFAFQEYWAARYEAGVRQGDYYIADLRDRLAAMSLWEDTYVIIVADHGEALCEHGFWGHGHSTHHVELHVPLLLRWPGVIPAGKRVRRTVRLIDVMPTVLDQLSLPLPRGIQGTTLSPHIAGRPPSDPTVAFAEAVKLGPEQRVVYVGDWKLILTVPTGRLQLFNVTEDPLEQTDLASLQPERVAQFMQIIDRQVEINQQLLEGVDVETIPLTPEQIKRLESLGYIRR